MQVREWAMSSKKARLGSTLRRSALALMAAVVLSGCTTSSNPSGTPASDGSAGAGGVAGSGASCESLPPMPKIQLCAPADAPAGDPTVLEGTVLQTGPGVGQDPCPPSEGGVAPEAFWFEIADASAVVWRFGISLPGVPNPLVAGQAAQVRYRQTPGTMTKPAAREITLRSQNGDLLAYLALDVDLDGLDLPDGIQVASGAAVCTSEDECRHWSAYSLDVTTSDSAEGTLHPSESKVIGGYLVVDGEYWRQIGSSKCPNSDYFPSHIVLGIAPAQQGG